MQNLDADIIVVGARCAGATLAAYLARSGASVLLLDRDTLPSDQVLSTHTIHPPGVDILDDVGIGEEIRKVTPPTSVMRLRKGESVIDARFQSGRAEYCPRRKRLDQLLQQAATAAGAQLLDDTRVTELLWDGDRVEGVRTLGRRGESRRFRARLVVGADGRHSTVARLVDADEYYAYDAPRAMYWGYWEAPDFWNRDAPYDFGMYIGHTDKPRVVFQTDHGQLLIGSCPAASETGGWRRDPLAALKADLARDPLIAPLVDGSEPDGRIRGTVKERYFLRRAAGPGWALVGDAGIHKEFLIGDGITEALIQARGLASEILAGADGNLVRWWRSRDVDALPLFFFGQDEGMLNPPQELQAVVNSNIARSPELMSRFVQVVEHRVSPYELLPASLVLSWTLRAASRGKLSVLSQFVRVGKRNAFVTTEMASRRRLLAQVEAQSRETALATSTQ